MYKILIIFFVLIITISFVCVQFVIYQPSSVKIDKYKKFYKNIYKLTEKKNNITQFYVKTTDNIELDTFYLKNPDSDKCTIFFHGNSGNISTRYDMIKFLYTYASVIIFDYRSYGRSQGNKIAISSKNMQNDAEAVWKYATQNLNIKPKQICLFGESLGCSVAIHLAYKLSQTHNINNYPHALILNSPFFSISSLIKKKFENESTFKYLYKLFGLLISLVFKHEYKSNEWILFINQKTKILIAHSVNDQVVPYTEGKQLFDLISQTHQNSEFVDIIGSHNKLGLTDKYIYSLAELFES